MTDILETECQLVLATTEELVEIEEEDEDRDPDFLGDDDWEDGPNIERIKSNYPDDWMVVKVINFTQQTLADVKEWCIKHCADKYDHIGWHGGCSYTVGVIFEGYTDAVMFKLTWGS